MFSDKASDVYSYGSWFKSQLGHRLSIEESILTD